VSGRRGFFALVGGAAVSGLVTLRSSAARPTLILPPALVRDTPIPAAYPLLAGHPSQMHAMLHIKGMVPHDVFLDWLESGLRGARLYNGRSEAETERRVEAAAREHGSIIDAMRAGALS